MKLIEIILLACAVSMDAFAVSVCRGLAAERVGIRESLAVGAWFGSFQALMPLLGCAVMVFFRRFLIVALAAPYIASALLVGMGANMIGGAFFRDDGLSAPTLSVWEMAALALATSIDAFASGVAMACTVTVREALSACFLVGAVTFLFSSCGVRIGKILGGGSRTRAAVFGGAVLILLGVRVFLKERGIW